MSDTIVIPGDDATTDVAETSDVAVEAGAAGATADIALETAEEAQETAETAEENAILGAQLAAEGDAFLGEELTAQAARLDRLEALAQTTVQNLADLVGILRAERDNPAPAPEPEPAEPVKQDTAPEPGGWLNRKIGRGKK